MFIADGAPYTDPYRAGVPSGLRAIAIGWLEAGHEYERGPIDETFVTQLFAACAYHAAARTRGWHACGFCGQGNGLTVTRDGESVVLGDADRAVGDEETVFVAPTLILHYVVAHGYQPPGEFIDAIARSNVVER